MDTGFLEEIGFTKAETKIYIALLKLGTVKASLIIQETSLQNSVVHLTLPKLMSKGLVSYIKKGSVRYFSATNPNSLLSYIEKKRDDVKSHIPDLLSLRKEIDMLDAEVFEGFKGLRFAYEKLVSNLKSGDDYYFFAFNPENVDLFEQIFNFYNHFDKNLEKRKIKVRGIVPKSLKKSIRNRNPKSIQYIDYPIPNNITFTRDKVLMNSYTSDGKINSFLISSESLANSFKIYFMSIWKK